MAPVKIPLTVFLYLATEFLAIGQDLKSHAPSWSDREADLRHPLQRIKVGAAWAESSKLSSPPPVYPAKAKEKNLQGTVRLHAIITREGAVRSLETVSGHPLLAQAAIDAVRYWKCRPTLLDGQPVEVDTVIDVVFQLTQKPRASNSSKNPQ
jgi:TonB family protein